MATLILALNPSIDAEWRVDDVLWEEKNNVHSERRWAGGKGINVARWLKHLGGRPHLLLPLGGTTGKELRAYLRREQLPATIIRVDEPTRVNVIVTTQAGRQIRFNPPGPTVSPTKWGEILRVVRRHLTRAQLLILSGSLPRGVPVSAYAQLIRLARQSGVKTLLDCDGIAFERAIKARPFLVKPNEYELAQWWRKPLRSERDLIKAANALSEVTRGWGLVSRGPRRSLLVNRSESFRSQASPPRVKVRNTVGAGDALLAAVARQIISGRPTSEWLLAGLTVGAAATRFEAGKTSAS